ncbi:MAG: VOC family protein [Chitinophagaceae bacterium]|nr:VOC family protein [Chitinophagaceae bacterium]MCB9047344.1 VOC family protein [Chitinophagales bacterium]
MISKLTHTFIYVSDQDESVTFYTEILGFELKANIPLGPDKKWVTVSPPANKDLEIVLMKASEGPFYTREMAEEINQMVSNGTLGWCVFECKDIYATYEELKRKGVIFKAPPMETPSGVSASFKDNSGNWFSLNQSA